MAENLKVTKYRNGDNIDNITTNSDWTSNTSGAYGVYNNDATTYLDSYGLLYNWYAVDNSSNICPEGWHVPTRDEYDVLSTYLGGNSVAGGKMKETGTEYWNSPNTGADNETSSGFNARGGGLRYAANGTYNLKKNYKWIWSGTSSGGNAYYRRLQYNSADFNEYNGTKNNGFSVRCLED